MTPRHHCEAYSSAGEEEEEEEEEEKLHQTGWQADPKDIMKFPGILENQRLSFLLEKAISREAQMWKVNVPKTHTNQTVSPSQRDEVIQWLAKLKYQFNLYPETFALASSLLDRFLATVKVNILSDILVTFQFHAIAVSTRPQLLFSLPKLSPSQHLAVLTKQLLHCMACNQLLQFKGSMLALAMVSLEMEKLIPDWLPLTIELLQKAQMDSSQLIHCRELVAHHLFTLQSSLPLNSVYVYRPLKHTLVTCDKGVFRLHHSSVSGPVFSKDNSKPEVPVRGTAAFYHHLPATSGYKHTSAKRKVEEMEVDDFYDGIKRLYNEDNASESVGSVCGTDLSRQEGHASPCPPLQPVSVM
ncbi:Cyclin-I [Galemys pyrenaicus]|uniref:Cyclin-I n=1 Tax=Galemys pyrenaicus TaxID=202257 RepID=A0A8J6DNZ4_GALPY|nr:Cyclin-I [Galemys pyrenaicus]